MIRFQIVVSVIAAFASAPVLLSQVTGGVDRNRGIVVAPGTTNGKSANVQRPITGRITMAEGLPPALHIEAALETPIVLPSISLPDNFLQMNEADRLSWYYRWKQSSSGIRLLTDQQWSENHKHEIVDISREGAFRIDDLQIGTYTMTVAFYPLINRRPDYDKLLARKIYTLTVPRAVYDGTPLDFGVLPARNDGLVNTGQLAPDFAIPVLDGKDMLLSQFRGKVVLLDFWGIWCGACVHAMPQLQAIYDKYKSNPNFAMISLSVDDEPQKVRDFLKTTKMPWTSGVLGDRHKAMGSSIYSVDGYPTYWLISPDGKTLANGHFTDFLDPLIDQALADAVR